MATPLDLRNRRREAQRAVRLAVNAINAGLDDWKAAVGDGKRHATVLANAVLMQLHLPAMPLALLAEVPNLRAAARAKLVRQEAEVLAKLADCLERLRAAVAHLAEATGGLQELLEVEAARPLLMEGAVFATLPLSLMRRMTAEVERMHQAELGDKAAALQGFEQILDELRTAEERERSGSSTSGGGVGRLAAQREEKLRRTMQVYVTAWLLSAEVDERRVEAHLALVTNDMQGF